MMISKTLLLPVDPLAPETEAIDAAARLLREGGMVAFPTETVYGLGADAGNPSAVRRIFEAKGRPSDNPLIVHISGLDQLDALTLPCGETARRLMDRFWPGPLTLVLPARPGAVSPEVTAGLDTVAVRMPDHPVALALIAAAGCPVAAPSANRSGRPSPTAARHVLDDLDGRIDAVVDGGSAGVGVESTVVEVGPDGTVRILRPGGITAEALREAAHRVECDAAAKPGAASEGGAPPDIDPQSAAQADHARQDAVRHSGDRRQAAASGLSAGPTPGDARAFADTAAPRSPGMKYAHYAPRGIMQLVQGEPAAAAGYIAGEIRSARARGERTGVLAFAEHERLYAGSGADCVLVAGSLARLESAAHGLYAALREFDDRGIERIWAETCTEEGIGHALMNRLAKAAGNRIVRVQRR